MTSHAQDDTNIASMNICNLNIFGKIKIDEKIIAGLITALIILVFLFQMILYIQQDESPTFTDGQFLRSLEYFKYYRNAEKLKSPGSPYPPLVYYVTLINYRLFGESMHVARLSMIVFAVIFLLSMYGIGYKFGNYLSGLVVLSLAASSPHILNFSRLYFLDFPQTAMTALVFYLILKSEGYHSTIYSILVGIALGFAVLTKWSTIFFIFFPLLWFIIPSILKSWKSAILFLVSTILIFIVLWRLYYFYNLPLNTDFSSVWLKYYIVNIIIPVIIFLCVGYYIKRRKLKSEDKTHISFGNIINFSEALFISIAIFSSWFLSNISSIQAKVILDTQVFYRNIGQTVSFIVNFLSFSYNYVWILIPVGILYILLNKRDLFQNLVNPFSIVFSIIIMLKFGYPYSRYMLSFIIFMSALGGWWVSKAGRFGKVATFLIVPLSIFSICGWILPSQDSFLNSVYLVWGGTQKGISRDVEFEITDIRPLTGKYPDNKIYDINPIIKKLKELSDCDCESECDEIISILYLDDCAGNLHDFDFYEYLEIEFKKRNFKLGFSRLLSYRDFDKFMNPSKLKEHRRKQLSDINLFLIKHNKETLIDKPIRKLKEFHPGQEVSVTNTNLPGGSVLTLICFD